MRDVRQECALKAKLLSSVTVNCLSGFGSLVSPGEGNVTFNCSGLQSRTISQCAAVRLQQGLYNRHNHAQNLVAIVCFMIWRHMGHKAPAAMISSEQSWQVHCRCTRIAWLLPVPLCSPCMNMSANTHLHTRTCAHRTFRHTTRFATSQVQPLRSRHAGSLKAHHVAA